MKSMSDRVRLICCVCGKYHFGVQWHGRDTGYGLCMNCVDFAAQYETEQSMKESYGIQGVHYVGVLCSWSFNKLQMYDTISVCWW
jgi:hypothetical protein